VRHDGHSRPLEQPFGDDDVLDPAPDAVALGSVAPRAEPKQLATARQCRAQQARLAGLALELDPAVRQRPEVHLDDAGQARRVATGLDLHGPAGSGACDERGVNGGQLCVGDEGPQRAADRVVGQVRSTDRLREAAKGPVDLDDHVLGVDPVDHAHRYRPVGWRRRAKPGMRRVREAPGGSRSPSMSP
jgi:hypothetical protein